MPKNAFDTSAPQLTVAVPAYNVESYLARGLESYLDPRFVGNLEVIVVDDGSTDGTRALAEDFAARSNGVIRVISKENGGHGSAVNAGIEHARGRYFRVIDGDDWVNADGMAELLDRLADLDCDLVVDKKREVDMTTGEERAFPLAKGVVPGRVLDFSTVLTNADTVFQIMIHTLTARTDYLRGIGIKLLEHTFYEDYEDDHSRVVTELLAYLERCEHDEVRAATGEKLSNEAVYYVREKVHLIVDTHYNIALLFDEDRSRGRARAKEFRRELRRADIDQWTRGEQRYRMAMLLNRLSLSYNSIKRLVARRRH